MMTRQPPCRYYLLATRPETCDSAFSWADLRARTNNELLANLGNFVNRVLKFTAEKLAEPVPMLDRADLTPEDLAFEAELQGVLTTYVADKKNKKSKKK
jgi:methionyl-tRNA synthetase